MSSAAYIHPTAVIEADVTLATGTKVWHHSHIRTGAAIGRDCTIGKNVFVDAGVRIGHRVKIQNNVSVYRGVTVEDDVFLGPSCVLTNDLYPRATNSEFSLATTRIRTGASVGANATIVCGDREIGEYAMIGAGAVVVRDVPRHALVAGNPARLLGYVCYCGQTLEKTKMPIAGQSLRCSACARTVAL